MLRAFLGPPVDYPRLADFFIGGSEEDKASVINGLSLSLCGKLAQQLHEKKAHEGLLRILKIWNIQLNDAYSIFIPKEAKQDLKTLENILSTLDVSEQSDILIAGLEIYVFLANSLLRHKGDDLSSRLLAYLPKLRDLLQSKPEITALLLPYLHNLCRSDYDYGAHFCGEEGQGIVILCDLLTGTYPNKNRVLLFLGTLIMEPKRAKPSSKDYYQANLHQVVKHDMVSRLMALFNVQYDSVVNKNSCVILKYLARRLPEVRGCILTKHCADIVGFLQSDLHQHLVMPLAGILLCLVSEPHGLAQVRMHGGFIACTEAVQRLPKQAGWKLLKMLGWDLARGFYGAKTLEERRADLVYLKKLMEDVWVDRAYITLISELVTVEHECMIAFMGSEPNFFDNESVLNLLCDQATSIIEYMKTLRPQDALRLILYEAVTQKTDLGIKLRYLTGVTELITQTEQALSFLARRSGQFTGRSRHSETYSLVFKKVACEVAYGVPDKTRLAPLLPGELKFRQMDPFDCELSL
jgi:hypothetical protein